MLSTLVHRPREWRIYFSFVSLHFFHIIWSKDCSYCNWGTTTHITKKKKTWVITTSFSNDIMPRGYCQVVAFNEAKIVRLGLVKFKIFLLVFQDNSPILEKKKKRCFAETKAFSCSSWEGSVGRETTIKGGSLSPSKSPLVGFTVYFQRTQHFGGPVWTLDLSGLAGGWLPGLLGCLGSSLGKGT